MKTCNPADVALKSFFLGPQAENAAWLSAQVQTILSSWFEWRRRAFPTDGRAISTEDQNLAEFHQRQKHCEKLLRQLLSQFEDEIPKFSPRYIGHMFSEISMPALLGHILTLLHNPNNISGEASRAGVRIEEAAVQSLGKMLGFTDVVQGHFTSGGTVANFEALSRAIARTYQWMLVGWVQAHRGQTHQSLLEWAHAGWPTIEKQFEDPEFKSLYLQHAIDWSHPPTRQKMIQKVFHEDFQGPVLLVPEHKHYSWIKGAHLFGVGQPTPVSLDVTGRLCAQDLKTKIDKALNEGRPICMGVSVFGSTELGAVDPLTEIAEVYQSYRRQGQHIWHHVDAAFGGFFACLKDSQEASPTVRSAVAGLSLADSVTIDPHKMGYVPYSSGTFILKSKKDYRIQSFSGPYLQMEEEKDKGPHTLEGSRSAAGAVATWLTAQSIGLDANGYGRILERTIQARSHLQKLLSEVPDIHLCPSTDLNVLGFCVASKGDSFKESTQRTDALFHQINEWSFYLSKTVLTQKSYGAYLQELSQQWHAPASNDDLEIVRICIMNPFFESKELASPFPEYFTRVVTEALTPRGR